MTQVKPSHFGQIVRTYDPLKKIVTPGNVESSKKEGLTQQSKPFAKPEYGHNKRPFWKLLPEVGNDMMVHNNKIHPVISVCF